MVLNLGWSGFSDICPLNPKFRALSCILAKGVLCTGGLVGTGVGKLWYSHTGH